MGIEITFVSNLKDVMDKIDETAKARMQAAVHFVQGEVLETLSKPGTGRTYRIPGTKATYTASAPGQPPARLFGELAKSISTEVGGEGKSIVGRVGTDLKKGAMLEFGTKGGKTISRKDGKNLVFWVDGHWVSKKSVIQGPIAPRPWLRPTFEKKQKDIEEIFIRQWF